MKFIVFLVGFDLGVPLIAWILMVIYKFGRIAMFPCKYRFLKQFPGTAKTQ
jgi:hypothetical protein